MPTTGHATREAQEDPHQETETPSVPDQKAKQPQAPDTPNTKETVVSEATPSDERKQAARKDQPSESTSQTTPEDATAERARQVIAVSASKGPAAFFNLARKFLVTDEMCDLSALEGAIVSAVDAAHLLERSKLATIVRVQTSYVSVEPKRRKDPTSPLAQPMPAGPTSSHSPLHQPSSDLGPRGSKGGPGRDLRRARIVITVQRTESYKQWLEENQLQAIIAGDGGDDVDEEL